MKVTKKITFGIPSELSFKGATLLSDDEAMNLLSTEEMNYVPVNWWLRSPGYDNDSAAYIDTNGIISSCSNYNRVSFSIRPALIINNLANTDFKVGDYFEIDNHIFKIISDELAFMIIGEITNSCFDTKSSVYQKSHIKKYLDYWFANLQITDLRNKKEELL